MVLCPGTSTNSSKRVNNPRTQTTENVNNCKFLSCVLL
jgi:hypothetical protein